MIEATVICTTHDKIGASIKDYCAQRLREQCGRLGFPLLVMPQRGHYSTVAIMTKLHAALLAAPSEHCFVVEHDVLYPDSYFCEGPCELSYSKSAYFLTPLGYIRREYAPLSSLFGSRKRLIAGVELLLFEHFKRGKVRKMEFGLGSGAETMRQYAEPFIDIRHGTNHTGDRGGIVVDSVAPWGYYEDLWRDMGGVPDAS